MNQSECMLLIKNGVLFPHNEFDWITNGSGV